MRTRLAVLTVLALAGSLLTAAAQDKGKDAKGAQDKGKEVKKVDKGTKATITKIDVDKKTISVTSEDGKKKMDVLVGKDTQFIGPRGGKSEDGIKDDRVTVGNVISVVFDKDGKTAREIHLPVRKGEKKEDAKKPAEKKPDPKKLDTKKTPDKKPA